MSDTKKTELATAPAPQRERDQEQAINIGSWWWVKPEDDEEAPWLGCVVHLGSNYVLLRGPIDKNTYYAKRVHLDQFDETCTAEPRAQEIINERIAEQREVIAKTMKQIQDITSRLAIGPGENDDQTKSLSIYNASSMDDYKKDLITAKDKTLPELFSSIEKASEIMKVWMQATLLPIEASSRRLQSSQDTIKNRIFGVELYAGLIEQTVRIADGDPAPNAEPVHLFQRRHYMDEECLANYQAGGMRFEQIEDFEKWLLSPENLKRIFPYPRCVIAFRIRRNKRDRSFQSISEFVRLMFEENADMKTFLYMRNGQRVYRLATGIDFGENLFPDTELSVLKHGKIYGVFDFGKVKRLATEGQYQDLLQRKAEHAKLPEEERWRHRVEEDDTEWRLWNQSSVYYDDITDFVKGQMEEHNRLVLVLQGLFDRSEVFHPHPQYKLWTPEDFGRAITLVHDSSRALASGDKPDFEAYRKRANMFLGKGAHTVGQNDFWQRLMAQKENERREREYRNGYNYEELVRFKPKGDPGPAIVAEIDQFSPTKGCTFSWERRKRSRSYFESEWPQGSITCRITVSAGELLCVEGYKPGDYHMFYDDPRSRAEYLQWAPLLLRAEEWHAGKVPPPEEED